MSGDDIASEWEEDEMGLMKGAMGGKGKGGWR